MNDEIALFQLIVLKETAKDASGSSFILECLIDEDR